MYLRLINFNTLTQELYEDGSLSLRIQDTLLYFCGSNSASKEMHHMIYKSSRIFLQCYKNNYKVRPKVVP